MFENIIISLRNLSDLSGSAVGKLSNYDMADITKFFQPQRTGDADISQRKKFYNC